MTRDEQPDRLPDGQCVSCGATISVRGALDHGCAVCGHRVDAVRVHLPDGTTKTYRRESLPVMQ